ncbi:heme-binding protein [Trichocoleus desertorum]|uniref:Heme-binding protein n=1 Tax=Trichocoleus desertorum GB2-A4 TaxID=2933944 RepID=A0ABV0JFU6_9CYAN|nr:heme-binding protein [Trichocoleus sp. FACHB-46]
MSKSEEPKYTVLQSYGDIEIRQYEPKIVAETVVKAERGKANNDAFGILAGYIFGQNLSVTQPQKSEKLAMTAPVMQQAAGSAIAMTTSVTQASDQNTWAVQFFMPSTYSMATLPKPKDERVTVKELPGTKVVAIRFSGNAGDNQLQEQEAKLRDFLIQQGIEAQGTATYAFYDSPFTLPMLKRNEVMIEIP